MSNQKYRTITLTGRAPVRIREDLWPLIAHGSWWSHHLRVRRHEDGRAIVYGTTDSRWQGSIGWAGGELLSAGADIAAAVQRVGADGSIHESAVRACMADFPAEEI